MDAYDAVDENNKWNNSSSKIYQDGPVVCVLITEGCVQVRRKRVRGLQWYRRKFRMDYSRLYLHYLPADSALTRLLSTSAPGGHFRIDLADVVEVRKGFSTDIFNEVKG
jgi:hypothetical protein